MIKALHIWTYSADGAQRRRGCVELRSVSVPRATGGQNGQKNGNSLALPIGSNRVITFNNQTHITKRAKTETIKTRKKTHLRIIVLVRGSVPTGDGDALACLGSRNDHEAPHNLSKS